MNIFNYIEKELIKYPEIKYKKGDNYITIETSNKNGFIVGLYLDSIDKKKYIVYYDGWHEEFDNHNYAFKCFMFGLTNNCRLKVYIKNKKRYKWIIEYNKEGIWVEDNIVGLFDLRFWIKPKIKYLQNDYIKVY